MFTFTTAAKKFQAFPWPLSISGTETWNVASTSADYSFLSDHVCKVIFFST